MLTTEAPSRATAHPAAERTDSGAVRTLKVAVIEDNRTIRTLLEKLVEKNDDFDLAGAWSTGESALGELPATRPDVVVVDLELPGISGEDCIRALSALLPTAAFVVLTVHEDPSRVFAALRAGANGYLLKGAPPSEIAAGIRAAARGGSPLSPMVAGMVIRSFQNTPEVTKAPLPLPSLTPRERQVLELLATGMVPKEAAAELNIGYETVRDYLKSIYQKLHVRSRTEAVLRFIEGGGKA